MRKHFNPRFIQTGSAFRLTSSFAFVIGLIAMLVSCDEPDMQCKKQAKIKTTQLVTGFEEFQGSAIGPGADLYVTAPLTGSIWRIDRKTGKTGVFATGLPARVPDPYFQGSGVVDVAFLGGKAYALVTGVAPDMGGDDVVGIYRMDSPNTFTVIADIGAWSTAHPPATPIFISTGYQYAIQTYKNGFIVTDGHHNRVLQVGTDGKITELVAFDNVVPTGLALQGHTVYLGKAGPIPHLPEDSKVFSFTMQSLMPRQLASGAGLENVGLLVDVEFGPGGALFGILQGYWDGPWDGAPAEPNTGALVKVNADGTFTILKEGLNQPTSLEIMGTTAYVVGLAGEVWTLEMSTSRACRGWYEQ